jgi:hypothetical protein
MKTVTRFEANLLRVLHFFLRRVPAEQVEVLLSHRHPAPRCLHRDAVELVQDALAKGVVQLLACDGGWRRERHLRGGRPVEGRLWERTPLGELRLTFSRHTLQFLLWITAAKPGDQQPRWSPPLHELTIGDQYLLLLVYDALRDGRWGQELRKRPAFLGHALCRLAFALDFVAAPTDTRLDFAPWTSGLGAGILEVWQEALAEHWLRAEAGKGHISDWNALHRLGQAQGQVLGPFLDALETAGRLDLARFLLRVAGALLPDGVTAQWWVAGLSGSGPRLAQRTATYRAALTVLRQFDRLRQWYQRARNVGYFDEGYAASQLWKDDWERHDGDTLQARAQSIIRQLEPLRP